MSKLKYVDTLVTFSEVPDEISLCINISNCPHRCKGCHSPYLQEDVGEELTFEVLDELINKNQGITCVCIMGGDHNFYDLIYLSTRIHQLGLKSAWYSGLDFHLNSMQDIIDRLCAIYFDYVKTGHYDENLGPLTSKTTNQRMYKKVSDKPVKFEDITDRFWKKYE